MGGNDVAMLAALSTGRVCGCKLFDLQSSKECLVAQSGVSQDLIVRNKLKISIEIIEVSETAISIRCGFMNLMLPQQVIELLGRFGDKETEKWASLGNISYPLASISVTCLIEQ